MATTPHAPIRRIEVAAYTIPTDQPESDGTLQWDSTTLITVRATAADISGFGYTYAHIATGHLIRTTLADVVIGCDAMSVTANHSALVHAIRNLGRPGISSTAIAAVDIALWDLKARLLDVSLVTLLGAMREAIPIYGSGGFTSYTVERLREQLGEWAHAGIRAVKMKIGRDIAADRQRVHAAREAIGQNVQLFVDANGAYDRKIALDQAARFAVDDVSWFEEPVSSDDLEGLRLLRDRVPAGMEIAAANTATRPCTSGACSKRARSMYSRPTPHDARASPASSKRACSATPGVCRCRPIPRRASTHTSVARYPAFVISSTFTTTCGSNACCSMACSSR